MINGFIDVTEKLPPPYARVWVRTDQGGSTTGYVKESGEWVINCNRLAAAGHRVVEWKS